MTARQIREYELADQTKSIWVREEPYPILLLISGQIDSLLEVCRATRPETADGRLVGVGEFAREFAVQFQQYRRYQIEQRFFQPLGLTIEGFMDRQSEWSPDLAAQLHSRLRANSDLGEALIVGFDESGDGAIYTVTEPGIEEAWNGTGFAAIGIGSEHAEAEIIKASYTPKRPWMEAMRLTFFAKKRAEEAPGVGANSDLWYLTVVGSHYFPPMSTTVLELERMYEEMRARERQEIVDHASQLAALWSEESRAETPEPQAREERARAEAEASDEERAGGAATEGTG